MSAKKAKTAMDPLERAKHIKRVGIQRWKGKLRSIRDRAESDIAEVQQKINREQVLLEALERGTLKP